MKKSPPQVEHPYAIAARALHSLPPERAIRHAVELRAKGIEWGETHAPAGDVLAAARVRNVTLEHDLNVAGYAAYWQGDQGLFRDLVATASALGAPTIRLGAVALASLARQDMRGLRHACDLAEEAGITVSLSYLPTALDSILGLVQEAAHPGLRLCWRPRLGWGLESLAGPLRGFRFCVLGVRLEELARLDGSRIPEAAVRAHLLRAPAEAGRAIIFDAAPRGKSLLRAARSATPQKV